MIPIGLDTDRAENVTAWDGNGVPEIFLAEKLLGVSQAEIKQKCQQRTKELEELKTAVDSLKNFNYLCTPTDDGFIPRVSLNPDFSFSAARKAVAEIKERLEELGREELRKVSKSVNEVPVYTVENRNKEKTIRAKEIHTVDSAPPAEPRSRSEFLKWYSAWHNRVDKAVSGPHSSRIGVFLDHSAGVLAFYSIGSGTFY
ncbi:tripartite motif-containing 16-like protein [Labeo rohita]|uniref:Tripartite motif-containing 16-like protein n=1 Tax=Labeo rohita TaxID=84645 RepID=A0A498LRP5_LABRO|nr:tripartite motif-containing 16-like protein [Labeo rohita]